MTTRLKLIVGLGNPGPEHAMDRHNAGYWFADTLASRYRGFFHHQKKFHGDISRVDLDGNDVRLLKPVTFMNQSGLAVRSLISYLDIKSGEILVAHDDLDLKSGTVRLKWAGGAGGHNGLRNVVSHIGPDFYRLRLGIGHPGSKSEVTDYVLRRASKGDEEELLSCIIDAVEVMPTLLGHGEEKAKTKLHSRGVTPKPYRKDKTSDDKADDSEKPED